ncbi:alpha/beta fold hydrolase [Aurantimonas endophytica]|uniref:Haloacetate dehalogenase n=1 Tax=Aurantimonas endophytica TaxID=1522175 RepID=A0A7W6HEK6_9HYPH|nr:alpha/beta hydrolase [Aurantimonas endophytica]MBB4003801.1 haloacetate dehalogenase [Aurantimonas endophytica]MCO6404655.1 alpha/beta fold hydrolase [Aurantimonas endophytica]
MFEGFEEKTIAGEGADIFVRIAGSGPPLLLLHGYPQTGAMWARIAPRLAERFTVVIPDLRGYGRSSAPANIPDNLAYSKRAMGRDCAAVMQALDHQRFHVAGHDRGARVAYRMALDMPERVERLAVLDIVPVAEVWERMDATSAMKVYHWLFLAQPAPFPETLIGADPVMFLDHTIASWTKTNTLDAFDPAALEEYRRAFARPATIAATCNDYRAGATIDWQLDREDRDAGRRIKAPTLLLWGSAGIPGEGHDPLAVWRPWCDRLEAQAIDAGHFIVEEAPEATLRALEAFFAA